MLCKLWSWMLLLKTDLTLNTMFLLLLFFVQPAIVFGTYSYTSFDWSVQFPGTSVSLRSLRGERKVLETAQWVMAWMMVTMFSCAPGLAPSLDQTMWVMALAAFQSCRKFGHISGIVLKWFIANGGTKLGFFGPLNPLVIVIVLLWASHQVTLHALL